MGTIKLRAMYQELLTEAGYGVGDAREQWREGPASPNSIEAFVRFANLPQAAEVATLLRVFSVRSGLRQLEDFSVACLPPNQSSDGLRRAATLLVGDIEVLVPMIDCQAGTLARVLFFTDSSEEMTRVLGERSFHAVPTTVDAGCWLIPCPGYRALDFLKEPKATLAVTRRIAGIRRRRAAGRRQHWHNPWLWDFVDKGKLAPAP